MFWLLTSSLIKSFTLFSSRFPKRNEFILVTRRVGDSVFVLNVLDVTFSSHIVPSPKPTPLIVGRSFKYLHEFLNECSSDQITPKIFISAKFGIRPKITLIISNSRVVRSEEHTSELQSRPHLVCR